jgi:hypothetical protein
MPPEPRFPCPLALPVLRLAFFRWTLTARTQEWAALLSMFSGVTSKPKFFRALLPAQAPAALGSARRREGITGSLYGMRYGAEEPSATSRRMIGFAWCGSPAICPARRRYSVHQGRRGEQTPHTAPVDAAQPDDAARNPWALPASTQRREHCTPPEDAQSLSVNSPTGSTVTAIDPALNKATMGIEGSLDGRARGRSGMARRVQTHRRDTSPRRAHATFAPLITVVRVCLILAD